MSRYYIDCEFDGHNGPLLSMAIVKNRGENLLIVTDYIATDPWVHENVLPVLHTDKASDTLFTREDSVGAALREFIGGDPRPIIIADSPVDIMRFCRAISTASDGTWASADYERMTFIVENVDCYPTDLPGAVQHNAYWDAMALHHKLTGAPA